MSIAVAAYIIGGSLGFIGIESLASLFTLCVYLLLATVSVWAYARFTGKHRDAGLVIDTVATLAYEQVCV